ncbi:hypothetical protein Vi05172_g8134 [Venturia inaequalis]|nr:hypothetical protein Vi05172_g8134 [Venturia inaequalis]
MGALDYVSAFSESAVFDLADQFETGGGGNTALVHGTRLMDYEAGQWTAWMMG